MFAGFKSGNEVRHRQKVVSFAPHLTTSKTRVYGHAISNGDIGGAKVTIGSVSTSTTSEIYIPGVGFFGGNGLSPIIQISGLGSSQQSSTSGGTVFYSVEEIKKRYIQFIKNQKKIYFHLRVTGETTKSPIALVTPIVNEVDVLTSIVKKAKLNAIEKRSKPTDEIERLIEERQNDLLTVEEGK